MAFISKGTPGKEKKKVFYFNENGNECDFVVFSYANQIEQVIQVCYDLNFDNQKREIKNPVFTFF